MGLQRGFQLHLGELHHMRYRCGGLEQVDAKLDGVVLLAFHSNGPFERAFLLGLHLLTTQLIAVSDSQKYIRR